MVARFGISVRDGAGNLVLVVEVDHTCGTDLSWAAQIRSAGLRSAPSLESAPLFVATPEHGYLWRRATAATPALLDLRRELAPTFARLRIPPSEISPGAFRALVVGWLHAALTSRAAPAPLQALVVDPRDTRILVGTVR